MRKILLAFLLMFVSVGIVGAKDDILIKKEETIKNVLGMRWNNPNREIYSFEDYYLIRDVYDTYQDGEESRFWSTYDKNWNLISNGEEFNEYKIYSGKNKFYSYFNAELGRDDIYTYLFSIYDENFTKKNIIVEYDYYCKDLNGEDTSCSLKVLDVNNINGKDVFLLSEYYLVNVYEGGFRQEPITISYKTLTFNDDCNDYILSDMEEANIKEMFPIYYYKKNVYDDKYNYYLDEDNLIISGDILAYYKEGEKVFEVTSDKYIGFGKAKIYNNLIITIGYLDTGDTNLNGNRPLGVLNTDILFYDLSGNLVGTYEDNAYNLDFIFDNEKLIVANLYVDGICGIGNSEYYKWNTDCNATFVNDIYGLEEEYLGMAISKTNDTKKEEIINPETLVSDVMILFFISLIFFVSFRLMKTDYRRI